MSLDLLQNFASRRITLRHESLRARFGRVPNPDQNDDKNYGGTLNCSSVLNSDDAHGRPHPLREGGIGHVLDCRLVNREGGCTWEVTLLLSHGV